jgi:membrane protein DedA with SNARE-associated domain
LSAPDSPAPSSAPDPGLDALEYSPEQLRRMRIWFGVLAVLGVAGWIGTFGVARLANDLPLLLIVLSPVNRHLVLVAPTVSPAAFLSVAIARGLVSCAVGFQLGRAVGKSGLRWLDARSPGFGRFVRWVERLFERSAPVAILLLPGLLVSLLAGISGMRFGVLLALACTGLALRMLAILGFALWFREEILWLLQFFDRNWLLITLAIVAIVALNRWRSSAMAASSPDTDRSA